MSEITRRDALSRLATAFAATAAIDYALGQEVHAFLQGGRAETLPRALTAQQYRTLERLVDLIIPVENGKSGAVQANVAVWIDQLLGVNAELKGKYDAGLTWLDTAVKAKGASDFASATPAQQTGVLDVIAFKKNETPETKPGIDFFVLARRMTVDGFYTSELGVRDILPNGRAPMPKFIVPQESVDYVINRSPFR
jgi:hypothetical protein